MKESKESQNVGDNQGEPIRTIYIPPMWANNKFWLKEIIPAISKTDSQVAFGNFFNPLRTRKENMEIYTYMIDWYARTSPNWKQLIGPNELIEISVNKAKNLDERKLPEFIGMWLNNDSFIHSSTHENGNFVSHGGLAYGEWLSIDKPQTAEEASVRINEKYDGTFFQGESYNTGHCPSMFVCPIWADPAREVYNSWVMAKEACPFPQITATNLIGNPTEEDVLLVDKSYPTGWVEKFKKKRYGTSLEIKGQIFKDISNLPFISPDEEYKAKSLEALYIEKRG